jgi:hypothetical protein
MCDRLRFYIYIYCVCVCVGGQYCVTGLCFVYIMFVCVAVQYRVCNATENFHSSNAEYLVFWDVMLMGQCFMMF